MVAPGFEGCCDALRIETRSSSFSSSLAVRDDGDFFDTRFRRGTIGWHSFPKRSQRKHADSAYLMMHFAFAREQFVQDRP